VEEVDEARYATLIVVFVDDVELALEDHRTAAGKITGWSLSGGLGGIERQQACGNKWQRERRRP
jgi:hypothetical protein